MSGVGSVGQVYVKQVETRMRAASWPVRWWPVLMISPYAGIHTAEISQVLFSGYVICWWPKWCMQCVHSQIFRGLFREHTDGCCRARAGWYFGQELDLIAPTFFGPASPQLFFQLGIIGSFHPYKGTDSSIFLISSQVSSHNILSYQRLSMMAPWDSMNMLLKKETCKLVWCSQNQGVLLLPGIPNCAHHMASECCLTQN